MLLINRYIRPLKRTQNKMRRLTQTLSIPPPVIFFTYFLPYVFPSEPHKGIHSSVQINGQEATKSTWRSSSDAPHTSSINKVSVLIQRKEKENKC